MRPNLGFDSNFGPRQQPGGIEIPESAQMDIVQAPDGSLISKPRPLYPDRVPKESAQMDIVQAQDGRLTPLRNGRGPITPSDYQDAPSVHSGPTTPVPKEELMRRQDMRLKSRKEYKHDSWFNCKFRGEYVKIKCFVK